MVRENDVLSFWFGDLGDGRQLPPESKNWFGKDPKFDALLTKKFLQSWEDGAAGRLADWENSPRGKFALLILFDQFSRNLFRNSPRAFSQDAHALRIANELVEKKLDEKFMPLERAFLYLPFEHSENLTDQRKCVTLITNLAAHAPDPLKEY